MPGIDPTTFFTTMVVILISLAIHEFAHAKLADAAGDPTPRIFGRVTLNPLAHLDPVGTIMILLSSMSGFGIGWGKPVPVNPSRMNNPRWDHFVSVAGGPLSNLLLAAGAAIVMRLTIASGDTENFALFEALYLIVTINLSLCFFNLIPLGPLDGHWMLGTFMSESSRMKWYLWNRHVGGFVLIVVVFGGQLLGPQYSLIGYVLRPAVVHSYRFLTGLPFPY